MTGTSRGITACVHRLENEAFDTSENIVSLMIFFHPFCSGRAAQGQCFWVHWSLPTPSPPFLLTAIPLQNDYFQKCSTSALQLKQQLLGVQAGPTGAVQLCCCKGPPLCRSQSLLRQLDRGLEARVGRKTSMCCTSLALLMGARGRTSMLAFGCISHVHRFRWPTASGVDNH